MKFLSPKTPNHPLKVDKISSKHFLKLIFAKNMTISNTLMALFFSILSLIL